MKKYITALMSAALIAGITLPSANAADEKKAEKKPAAAKAKSTKKKRDTYPFRGTVGSVDGDKLVLKQKSGDRTITVDKKARVMKRGADGQSKIKLSDIQAGAYVTGMVKKVDGKEVAVAVYERPKPQGKSKSKGKGKKKKDS